MSAKNSGADTSICGALGRPGEPRLGSARAGASSNPARHRPGGLGTPGATRKPTQSRVRNVRVPPPRRALSAASAEVRRRVIDASALAANSDAGASLGAGCQRGTRGIGWRRGKAERARSGGSCAK
jgi:hypothetical protein